MKNVERKWTVQDAPSQAGRLAVVTGATSGIGFFTAKKLARMRATVIIPARDMRNEAKGNPTAAFEPPVTKDATIGRRLWDESERITGAQFVVSAPSIGIHDRHCVGDAKQPVSRAE